MEKANTHSLVITNPVVNICITVIVACSFYIILDSLSLKHSAALFLGIPLIMTLLLTRCMHTKSITRHMMTGLIVGLIASYVVLKEGSFCVPMTAPLFLFTGLVTSQSLQAYQHSRNSQRYLLLTPCILILMLSLEGISEKLSVKRTSVISYTSETSLGTEEIIQRLSQNNQITKLPLLLRWGFPQPVNVSGSGINVGATREIYFAGGEGKPGSALFKLIEQKENMLKFELVYDDSHISHWLNWKSSTVRWNTTSHGKTQINWEIEYQRQLDPSWYFGPLQNLAVKAAAKTLVDNLILYN